jgi:hypothetical protein
MPAVDALRFFKVGKYAVVFYMNGFYFARPNAGIAGFALPAIPLNYTVFHKIILSAMEIFIYQF